MEQSESRVSVFPGAPTLFPGSTSLRCSITTATMHVMFDGKPDYFTVYIVSYMIV